MDENVDKLNRQLNYYEKAKKDVNNTIKELTEIKNILSDKNKFILDTVDNIVVDIEDCLNNLSNSKKKVNNAIKNIKQEINTINEANTDK